MPTRRPEPPTILVVLGATGDLMKKKIIPSIYHLHASGRLPKRFRAVGVSRRPMTNASFRTFVQKELKKRLSKGHKQAAGGVAHYFSYSKGDFTDPAAFVALKKHLDAIDLDWGVCTNKLFYLAVPPEQFEPIFKNMARVKLNEPCGGAVGWTRVLVEKPFGSDEKSAKNLCALLSKYVTDEQLYLIDHYLAKEIVQAIFHFRFSNNLFERSWDKNAIERIDIRLLETIGAQDRGAFYDAVGAFRDVGQNHLLQMLAAITMDVAPSMNAGELRRKRAELLETLKPWSTKDVRHNTYRAQYDGFRTIPGVAKRSQTETYFKLQTELLHPAWRGIPITLEAGKRCPEVKKEIAVTFKHPQLCVACMPGNHIHNRVVFGIGPQDRISIHFWTKRPGFEHELEERTFDFFLYDRTEQAQYVEEYAELIFNCLMGDQRTFVSVREIMAEWRFADPVVRAWNKNTVPLARYAPGSDAMIRAAAALGARCEPKEMKKELGIIGLGKMGANMAHHMMDQGWTVAGYNRSPEPADALAQEGMIPAHSLKELVEKLSAPRVIWLMVPAGKPVDDVLFGKQGVVQFLKKGDTVIDGGNSFYKDTVARAKKLHSRGIRFLDAGTSGGPGGARQGACLMIGGARKDFAALELLFRDFAVEDGYQFFDGHGAGHFIKMIHNGIEYGMMQAIAEGFTILKRSTFSPDLTRVADVYNHGSVIESRLIGWLKDAFESYGEDLAPISGTVDQSGEGKWTVQTAHEMKVADKVIHEALRFRSRSAKKPSYTGRIVSALRGEFGGHSVTRKRIEKLT